MTDATNESSRDSVEPNGDDGDAKVVSSLAPSEPVVTRKELWSYYSESPLFISQQVIDISTLMPSVLQW